MLWHENQGVTITPFLHELNTIDACWIEVDVWSNSSRCRQESVYYSWTWCLYDDYCLDIVMIIWSSINCPTVICSPTVCYFSREKPLVKPTAPGTSFSYICLAIYFFLAFIFRSIKPKIQKYLAAIYLFCDLFILSTTFYPTLFAYLEAPYPEVIDNPFIALVARLLFVCVGTRDLRVASYWIDTLVLKN